jgi:hypothetical protein
MRRTPSSLGAHRKSNSGQNKCGHFQKSKRATRLKPNLAAVLDSRSDVHHPFAAASWFVSPAVSLPDFARSFIQVKCWRATVDEDGHYSFAVAL